MLLSILKQDPTALAETVAIFFTLFYMLRLSLSGVGRTEIYTATFPFGHTDGMLRRHGFASQECPHLVDVGATISLPKRSLRYQHLTRLFIK